MKAATSAEGLKRKTKRISIHAAREGGDEHRPEVDPRLFCISIHAAREGGDAAAWLSSVIAHISIHAAREGGDCISRTKS